MFYTFFVCFSPYLVVWGGGGGVTGSRAHNPLTQFSGLGSSKMEISETNFFDTLTIQKDQISYVKHVLAPLYVFFTLFGWGRGWLPRGLGHNLLMQFSRLSSSRMVVPLPSSRCLAEGNRISDVPHPLFYWHGTNWERTQMGIAPCPCSRVCKQVSDPGPFDQCPVSHVQCVCVRVCVCVRTYKKAPIRVIRLPLSRII